MAAATKTAYFATVRLHRQHPTAERIRLSHLVSIHLLSQRPQSASDQRSHPLSSRRFPDYPRTSPSFTAYPQSSNYGSSRSIPSRSISVHSPSIVAQSEYFVPLSDESGDFIPIGIGWEGSFARGAQSIHS